jgi:hypothetical protein
MSFKRRFLQLSFQQKLESRGVYEEIRLLDSGLRQNDRLQKRKTHIGSINEPGK